MGRSQRTTTPINTLLLNALLQRLFPKRSSPLSHRLARQLSASNWDSPTVRQRQLQDQVQVEQGEELKRSGLQLLEREARAPWSKSFSKTKIVGHMFVRGNVDGAICISARNSQRRKEQAGVLDNPDASNLASETKCALSAKVPSVMKMCTEGETFRLRIKGRNAHQGKPPEIILAMEGRDSYSLQISSIITR